jgi:hypothetical protein
MAPGPWPVVSGWETRRNTGDRIDTFRPKRVPSAVMRRWMTSPAPCRQRRRTPTETGDALGHSMISEKPTPRFAATKVPGALVERPQSLASRFKEVFCPAAAIPLGAGCGRTRMIPSLSARPHCTANTASHASASEDAIGCCPGKVHTAIASACVYLYCWKRKRVRVCVCAWARAQSFQSPV